MFKILLNEIKKIDQKSLNNIDKQELYNKFTELVFKYSTQYKSPFIQYDSAEFFKKLNNDNQYNGTID